MTPKRIHAGMGLLLAFIVAAAPARSEDGEFYVNTYRSIGTVSPWASAPPPWAVAVAASPTASTPSA